MNLHLTFIPSEESIKYGGDKTASNDIIKEIVKSRFHELKIGKVGDIDITREYTPDCYYDLAYYIKCYFEEWYNTNEAINLKKRIEKVSPQFVYLVDNRYQHICDVYERCYWSVTSISECGAGIGF